jgi:hypothetical protein
MIDTDKYEGHLAYLDYELWAFTDFMNINATHEERCATDALLNDASLLLEEVKRLRALSVYKELEAEVKRLREQPKVTIDDWDKKGPCVTVYLEGCEYVGTLRLYKDENGKVVE